MKILMTNDDGYQAKGIHVLKDIMDRFGEVTVIAPSTVQSGKSMAVDLGVMGIRYTSLGDGWNHLTGTPASCVKFGLNIMAETGLPDVVVSGINHGANAAVASCYSGTLGAAEEAVVNFIPGIGVSLFDEDPDADFSAVEKYFPSIFEKLMAMNPAGNGIYYNVNFPKLPADKVKGIRVCSMGLCRWVGEFEHDPDGTYHMIGQIEDNPDNTVRPDHHGMVEGYVTIVPHRVDNTDYEEFERMRKLDFDAEFLK